MRQGAEQSAPTSFTYTITCMIMLIIINRIQLLYYSSFNSSDLLTINNRSSKDTTNLSNMNLMTSPLTSFSINNLLAEL